MKTEDKKLACNLCTDLFRKAFSIHFPPQQEIIEEFRLLPQWVLWKLEEGNRKVPFSLKGHRVSSTNPDHWAKFAECGEAYRTRRTGFQPVSSPQGWLCSPTAESASQTRQAGSLSYEKSKLSVKRLRFHE